jgi:flagellin-specific chaperone FliS
MSTGRRESEDGIFVFYMCMVTSLTDMNELEAVVLIIEVDTVIELLIESWRVFRYDILDKLLLML